MSLTSQTESFAVEGKAGGGRNHFYWLDWVRFAAALMVVATHARGGLWIDWGKLDVDSKSEFNAVFFALTRAGTEWVLVFFVLSGYLVGGRLIERVANGSFEPFSYALDRITRLWIVLVPALVFSGAVAYLTGKTLSWFEFTMSIFGFAGVLADAFAENYPLWSLTYEIWFYFLAGSLATFYTYSNRTVATLLAVVIAFLVFSKLNAVFLFSWMLGALAYSLKSVDADRKVLFVGILFAATGFVLSQIRSSTGAIDLTGVALYAPTRDVATLVLAAGIALVLPFLARSRPATCFWRKVDGLGVTLASFSYTLYLIHYPVLYLWEHFFPGRYVIIDGSAIAWYLLRVSSCLVVGWLLSLPFERRTVEIRNMIRAYAWKKRWVG